MTSWRVCSTSLTAALWQINLAMAQWTLESGLAIPSTSYIPTKHAGWTFRSWILKFLEWILPLITRQMIFHLWNKYYKESSGPRRSEKMYNLSPINGSWAHYINNRLKQEVRWNVKPSVTVHFSVCFPCKLAFIKVPCLYFYLFLILTFYF